MSTLLRQAIYYSIVDSLKRRFGTRNNYACTKSANLIFEISTAASLQRSSNKHRNINALYELLSNQAAAINKSPSNNSELIPFKGDILRMSGPFHFHLTRNFPREMQSINGWCIFGKTLAGRISCVALLIAYRET